MSAYQTTNHPIRKLPKLITSRDSFQSPTQALHLRLGLLWLHPGVRGPRRRPAGLAGWLAVFLLSIHVLTNIAVSTTTIGYRLLLSFFICFDRSYLN